MRGRPVVVIASVLVAALLGCGTDGGSADRSASSAAPSGRPPSTTPSIAVPTTFAIEEINDSLIIEDGYYLTIEEMAQAADPVIVGDVVEVLKGEPVEPVVLAWDAIQLDSQGNRIATFLSNGIRPPQIGDHILLFLDPPIPSFVEAHGGAPTHTPTVFDGVAYLDGDRVVAGESSLVIAGELLTMSLPEVRWIVQEAVEHPREVGPPIQPGGG